MFVHIPSSPKKQQKEVESDEERQVLPEGHNIFLLAPKSLRTLKYLFALATGIPCVHYRWVLDSQQHSEVLDWTRYMLTAADQSLGNSPALPVQRLPFIRSPFVKNFVLQIRQSAF